MLNVFEEQGFCRLLDLLKEIPVLRIVTSANEPMGGPDRGYDFSVTVDLAGRNHTLVCDLKENGQPRYVRNSILKLRSLAALGGGTLTPVVIAPHLSKETQSFCRDNKVAYLDLEGNAWLTFDTVFIERVVPPRPTVERRELRSLFKPKSAAVLRVMLREPARAWKVVELAQAADVSLGHVSNVRKALQDREWGQVSDEGIFLLKPARLLEAWRQAYEPVGEILRFYTPLHGQAMEDQIVSALVLSKNGFHAALASFSAAKWLAPFGRTSTLFFVADHLGVEQLVDGLRLKSVSSGENVRISVPQDTGILQDTIEPAPGIYCTSLVQTYLDLSAAGERGREAADHLKEEMLTWHE
ncbi:type IV toxin-antitoxin system AbiEi family antitoxin [Rhizobium leguminosarum]|uniref:type IV toxin-antitoxin system AbiEi family antitoxin n=1 Tax=Rhizobium leguminosarum TaxID=384 RepID=UPI003F9C9F75